MKHLLALTPSTEHLVVSSRIVLLVAACGSSKQMFPVSLRNFCLGDTLSGVIAHQASAN